LHTSDSTWDRWGVEAVSLADLVEHSDGLVLLLPFFERFRGLVGERLLESARPGQVLVGLSQSGLLNEAALARALRSGKLRAAWFDSMEPGWLESGRPLHGMGNLQVTPRLAGTTRESRVRAAWAVARSIDELLGSSPKGNKAKPKVADYY